MTTTTAVTISLPRPHKTQRDALRAMRGARFAVLCAGRRWGKDVLLTRLMVRRAVNTPAPYAWYAPTYRVMRDNWRTIYDLLQPLISSASRSEWRMELVNGSVLEYWSLDNYDAARGRSYAWAVINEAAAYPHLLDAWHYVILPTLADRSGGAVFASTPRGLNGYYTLWQAAGNSDDWARVHYTTLDNPHIPASEVSMMRATMPEAAYRQEVLAEFVTDGAYFRGVQDAAVIDAPDEPSAHSGHRIVAGLDWGQVQDYTVLTVLCATCGRVVDWWRGNGMSYVEQRARVAEVLQRWGAPVLPERNSIGGPNIEELMRAGVTVLHGPDARPGYATTATSKPDLIMRLALALERGEIAIPRSYTDELLTYQADLSLSGRVRYSAPSGAHDDRVISLALALWAGSGSGASFRVGW